MVSNDATCRKILMILGFSGFAILYMLRVNLSVAIIAMSNHHSVKNISIAKDIKIGSVCPYSEPQMQSSKLVTNEGEFDWNEKLQGNILGYFFKGYVFTNLIGGRLADSFGGRKVYGLGVLLTALLALLLPMAARSSTEFFSLIRFLQGLTEGVTFPAMNAMMASWVPPKERTLFLARVVVGAQFGTIVTMAGSGWISQSWLGWPNVFYLSGFIGISWCFMWFRYTADNPASHPYISESEKLYIQLSIGKNKSNKKLSVPWSRIFTSVPFLALIVAHVGNNWGFYCLLTELPSYLSSVHHLNMKNSGLVSALPFFVMFLTVISFSSFIDYLITTKKLTTRSARRLSTYIGFFGPIFLLMSISSAGCNTWLSIVLICSALGIVGANNSGYLCNFQELAPNFAGTITGIANTLGSIPGFLAPQITGIIINNEPTIQKWDSVFTLTSVIYFVSGSFYLIYMSTDVQPWNADDFQRKKKSVEHVALIKEV